MGKFDGPHFRTDDCIVSLWIAKTQSPSIPDDYFEEDFESDDEDDFNPFSADFGFGYYDHDQVELLSQDDGKECQLDELLATASFSSSFIGGALERACALGLEKTTLAFLIYKFRYDPQIAAARGSRYMTFVGCFHYQVA